FLSPQSTTTISPLSLHDALPIFLGRPGRKGRVEVPRDREQTAHDVIGVQLVGLDERAEQLIGGGENLSRLVADDGRGPTDPLKSDRKSTRLNSSHSLISYAVFCL